MPKDSRDTAAYLVLKLSTGKVVARSHFTELPIPDALINHINSIAAKEGILSAYQSTPHEYTQMANEESFSTYQMKFDKLADEISLSDEVKAALICTQSNQNHTFQLQLLPNRLLIDTKNAMKQGLDYKKTCDLIRTSDEIQHTNYAPKDDSIKDKRTKNARKVANTLTCEQCIATENTKCYNCFNYGHKDKECELNACWRCQTWGIHKAFECKNDNRSDSKGSKTSNAKPDNKPSTKSKSSKQQTKQSKTNGKKKLVRTLAKSKGQDDNASEDSSDEDSSSSDSDSSTSSNDGGRVRFNRSLTSCTIKTQEAIIDSGSEEHMVTNTEDLLAVQTQYNTHSKSPPINMFTANGQQLHITAKGKIARNITYPAYVSNELGGTNLLSGPRLQKQGLWVILPPTDQQNEIGCIIANKEGQIMGTTRLDLRINPNNIKVGNYTMNVPTITDIKNLRNHHAYSVLSTTKSIKGFTHTSRAELVNFVHTIGHWSKQDMIWMSKNNHIENWPITAEEVHKYLKPECECCPRGNFHRDSTNHNEFSRPNTSTRNTERDKSHHDHQMRNNIIGEEVAVDLYEFMKYKKINYRDKASGFAMDIDIKSKQDSPEAISLLIQEFARYGHHTKEFNRPISTLKKDNENVLRTTVINKILRDNGIISQNSPSYEHKYNGLIENDTKTTKAKTIASMACAPHLPKSIWRYVWTHSHRTQNLRPSRRPETRDTKTRFEDFTHHKPNMWTQPLLPSGQPVNYSLDNINQLDTVCHIGAYLGPSNDTPGSIRILDVETGSIIDSSNYKVLRHMPSAFNKIHPDTWKTTQPLQSDGMVKTYPYNPGQPNTQPQTTGEPTTTDTTSHPPGLFEPRDENKPPTHNVIQNIPNQTINTHDHVNTSVAPPHEGDSHNLPHEGDSHNLPYEGDPHNLTHEGDSHNILHESDQQPTAPHDVIQRNINYLKLHYTKQPHKNRLEHVSSKNAREQHQYQKRIWKRAKRKVLKTKKQLNRKHSDNPTLAQARKRTDWPRFKEAIEKEYQQMIEEEVYDILAPEEIDKLPKDTHIIGSMMNLTIKRNKIDDEIDKYKGRLVALGNQQKIDQYKNIRSPTARSSSSKLLISIQAKLNSKSRVIDVKGAYLKAPIDEDKDILIRLPNGKIARLNKYLYGLKQSGYQWSQLLSRTLLAAGYDQSAADPCVFSKWLGTEYIIMSTHVDDFYVISNNTDHIDTLETTLTAAFGTITTKSDNILEYLGMAITTNEDDTITISQTPYITKILDKANMSNCNSVPTPYSEKTTTKPTDKEKINSQEYLELIGMLNYAAVLTRPDILYPVSRLAQKCSNPTAGDLRKVYRVFRYLQGTKHLGITFKPGDGKVTLYGYVDASYHTYDNAASQYGYSFSLHSKGTSKDSSFYARSSKMKLVTLSSTESEYVAAAEATGEIMFLRQLLSDIGFPQSKPTVIYEDNKSCIQMINGAGNHQRTKHINAKYHFTRQQVKHNIVKFKYKSTSNMVADIFTKGSIPKSQFEKLRHKLLNM